MKGAYFITILPVLPAILNIDGLDNVNSIAFIAAAFLGSAWPSFTITCRHLYNCSWMLIFTGHTLVQDPQRVEANGRSAYCFMSRFGARIEPIGPAMAVW